MEIALSIVLFVIFILLGLIHFNWMLGSKWGWENALPVDENGEFTITPGKFACGVVGVGLVILGVFYLVKAGIIPLNVPDWILTAGSWVIPFIFIIRAIGDFKHAGFFKKVKDTNFGKWDTRLFSPLCLAIGVMGLILNF